jgi:uncharacterized protein (DUF885 family)
MPRSSPTRSSTIQFLRGVGLAALLGTTLLAPPHVAANPAKPTQPAVAVAQTPAQRLAGLAERYYDAQARFEPLEATFAGDNRFDDQLPMTHVPAVRARRFAMLRGVQQELRAIDRTKLGEADQTSYDILSYDLNNALMFEPLRDYLMPINQMDNLPLWVARMGSGQVMQRFDTPAQYDLYLRRIGALPRWVDAAIAAMRSGMREKITLPKPLVQQLSGQIKALASAPLDRSEYTAPVRQFPAAFKAADKGRLTRGYHQTVRTRVLPALRRLAAFLDTEYLPAARDTAGWNGLPDGGAWYRSWVIMQTTTNLKPDEIHRIGMAEVERIQREMSKVAPKLGYMGGPAGLNRWISQQTKFRPFTSEEEVLQAYRDLNAKIMPLLPQLFGTLPKTALEIRAVPPLGRGSASDHYTAAPPDGSRPGIFWAVIPDPAAYPSTRMTSMFLHEGQPGHHLQLSRQLELAVPKFRQFGRNNAYVEGWGLYAESLGKEMGLYDDPNAYAGHLILDMVRAARLVVDTGLHALGWTREQAIRFLVDQTGESEDAARNAVERYMAMPAQALGYKIGALKIAELRQRAETALGDKFSLARFHDTVLAQGSMPLALLDSRINAWIAQEARAAR